MRNRRKAEVGALALLLLAGLTIPAAAQSVELGGNVAITSDYAFRGISQTLQEAAVQGGVDAAGPYGVYAGVWGSSVNFGEDLAGGPRAQMEMDAYAGIAPSLAGFDLDLGLIYYAYPGAASDRSYNFTEVHGGISRALGPTSLGLSASYSPAFFADSGVGVWLGADGSVEIPGTALTIEGSLGRQAIEDNGTWGTPDYIAWKAGVSTELLGVSLGAAVTGTDLSESECFGGSELCSARVIVSVGRGI